MYECLLCNFSTNDKTKFNKHLQTKKHIRNNSLKEKEEMEQNKKEEKKEEIEEYFNNIINEVEEEEEFFEPEPLKENIKIESLESLKKLEILEDEEKMEEITTEELIREMEEEDKEVIEEDTEEINEEQLEEQLGGITNWLNSFMNNIKPEEKEIKVVETRTENITNINNVKNVNSNTGEIKRQELIFKIIELRQTREKNELNDDELYNLEKLSNDQLIKEYSYLKYHSKLKPVDNNLLNVILNVIGIGTGKITRMTDEETEYFNNDFSTKINNDGGIKRELGKHLNSKINNESTISNMLRGGVYYFSSYFNTKKQFNNNYKFIPGINLFSKSENEEINEVKPFYEEEKSEVKPYYEEEEESFKKPLRKKKRKTN